MNCKRLKFCESWFLSIDGYVFKVRNGKETRIHIFKSNKAGNPYVIFNNIKYRIIDLMIEYWVGPVKLTDRVSYKILHDFSIPLSSIIVKPFLSKFDGISLDDENKLHQYGCETRAWSANSRSDQLITAVEVYIALKTHDFKCVYCNRILNPLRWHLDHFYPLSKTGTNRFENLVPACSRCNLMKSNIDPYQFIAHCKRIIDENRFSEKPHI